MNAYKDIIEDLRKKNGLSMQEICGEYIAHSSYSRFINKRQTLSAEKLIYILSQMDLSFREVGLFDQVIQTTNADKIVMAQVIHSGDATLMKQTIDLFASKSKREYDT